jgi:hypothetical protein
MNDQELINEGYRLLRINSYKDEYFDGTMEKLIALIDKQRHQQYVDAILQIPGIPHRVVIDQVFKPSDQPASSDE